MGCFMGIDLGTSSLKTVVMDESGTVLCWAWRPERISSALLFRGMRSRIR